MRVAGAAGGGAVDEAVYAYLKKSNILTDDNQRTIAAGALTLLLGALGEFTLNNPLFWGLTDGGAAMLGNYFAGKAIWR